MCICGWFTSWGFKQTELEELIQSRGGIVQYQVTPGTTHLLYGDRAHGTKKWNMASGRGLTLVSAEDFFAKRATPAYA